MKRISKLLIVFLFVLSVFCTSACNVKNEGTKSVTVYIVGATESVAVFNYSTTKTTAKELLDELESASVKSGETVFSYETESGSYGEFIVSMLGKSASGKGYWAYYTSVRENGYEEYTETLDGKTYYSAALGISAYLITDGESLVFKYFDEN